MHVCVWEGKKRNPLQDSTAYQSWVGFLFFQFMQDIFVLFARSKDKAALFHMKPSQLPSFLPHCLSCQLDPTSRWHQDGCGNAFICIMTMYDMGPHSLQAYITPMDLRTYPQFLFHRLAEDGMEMQREMPPGWFLMFPQRIKKPLTNCWRFICLNLHCGSCLIHRAWKSFFFHRNNLQPPDLKINIITKLVLLLTEFAKTPILSWQEIL